MTSRLIMSAALCSLLAANAQAETDPVLQAGPDQLAFSIKNMDTKIDPAVDFYRYASGGWLERVDRPKEFAAYGIFTLMTERLIKQVSRAAAKVGAKASTVPKGSPGQQVGDFYNAFMDVEAIDAAGIEPIRGALDDIASAASLKDLTRISAEQVAADGPGLFAMFGPAPDPTDNQQYAMFALGQSFGIDRHFQEILRAASDSPALAAYRTYIQELMLAAGYSETDAKRIANLSIEIETRLYSGFLSPVEAKNPANRYAKMDYADVQALIPDFDLDLYLSTIGFDRPDSFYMFEPRALPALAKLWQDTPLTDLKDYAAFRMINNYAPFLSSKLHEPQLRLEEALLGARNDRPRSERIYGLLADKLGHPASQVYVDAYYSAETKAEVLDLIERIKAVFRRRIETSDWLSDSTRAEALRKIDKFYYKAGYPDRWIDFSSVEIGHDPVANMIALGRFEMQRTLEEIKHAPVHEEFNARSTLPMSMNAAYTPQINGFEITAAITQPPAFSADMDAPLKFCRIGAVIGHEMTHGFDFSGRQFDADGNYRNWWTEADSAAFQSETQKLIDQADAFEVLPGLHINGALGVGENMADVGGITFAHEALKDYLNEHPEEDVEIDGLSPSQRCFIGWAQFWAMTATEPYLRNLVANDGHAPDFYRSVAALQHVDAFYDAFEIEEGDPMWLAPERRARAW